MSYRHDLPEAQLRDYGKENVRRLREIQRRCRELEVERERARPTPVKALWTSSKYQSVPSKVMAHLQVRERSWICRRYAAYAFHVLQHITKKYSDLGVTSCFYKVRALRLFYISNQSIYIWSEVNVRISEQIHHL